MLIIGRAVAGAGASALFSGGKERSRGGGGMTGVIVGVCGPSGLGDEVRKAVAGFDPASRKRVGGIELHEECVPLVPHYITAPGY